ncbi:MULTISPECIES: metal-dependent hydrolase [Micrococcaceae]|nr:hypothetical protein CIK75_15935 [Glutamicibacter sp. BW78]
MMGANHAAMGAGSWFAVTATAPGALGIITTDPKLVLIGMFTTAGAALLPDWDHRKATITWSLPPLSNIIARVLEKVAGGHRAGTHSLLGIMFFTAIAWAAGLLTHTTSQGHTVNTGAGIVGLFLVSLAVGALKAIPSSSYFTVWGIALACAGFIAWFSPTNPWWVPMSVGVGVAVHILGDFLTVGGVKIFWPIRHDSVAVPILGKTGEDKLGEILAGTIFGLYFAYALIWTIHALIV